MKYHQSKNEELQKVIADQKLKAESHKQQNDDLYNRIQQISGCLNIKTQEVILQQEAFDEKQKSFDELNSEFNEQNNNIL